MKRKILALLLALAVAFSLVGCAAGEKRGEKLALAAGDKAGEADTSGIVVQGTLKPDEVAEGGSSSNKGNTLSEDDQKELVELFESEKGKAWLSDYFFGEQEDEMPMASVPQGDAQTDKQDQGDAQTDRETPDTQSEYADPEAEVSSQQPGVPAEPQDAYNWDNLTDEQKVDYIEKYLRTSDWLKANGEGCGAILQGRYKISEYGKLDGDPNVIVDKCIREGFEVEDWLALYGAFKDDARKAVDEIAKTEIAKAKQYSDSSVDPSTSQAVVDFNTQVAEANGQTNPQPEPAGKDEPLVKEQYSAAGKGYDWLSNEIQGDKAIQNKIWSDLSDEDRAALMNDFLSDETGSGYLMDYFKENPDELKQIADESGYRKEVFKSYLPIFIGVIGVIVFVAVICMVIVILLMKKQQPERPVESAQSTQQPAASSKYVMNPELKRLLQNSPVYPETKKDAPVQAYVAPVQAERPAKTAAPAAPVAPAAPATPVVPAAPAAPAVPVVDGYYDVSPQSIENARIHLNTGLVLRKVSDYPTNPPVPYVHYSDNTVGLNMDYYVRVGGKLPNGQNARAWDDLMSATVQIGASFHVVTSGGEAVTSVGAAAGKTIGKVERAKLNADGSIAVPGRIIIE